MHIGEFGLALASPEGGKLLFMAVARRLKKRRIRNKRNKRNKRNTGQETFRLFCYFRLFRILS